jgi:hypothetical protein
MASVLMNLAAMAAMAAMVVTPPAAKAATAMLISHVRRFCRELCLGDWGRRQAQNPRAVRPLARLTAGVRTGDLVPPATAELTRCGLSAERGEAIRRLIN